MVKLWNLRGGEGGSDGPAMVVGRNLEVGKVFSATWAPDEAVGFRLAVAGSKGVVQIWVRICVLVLFIVFYVFLFTVTATVYLGEIGREHIGEIETELRPFLIYRIRAQTQRYDGRLQTAWPRQRARSRRG
jgi:hypothetical protein